MTAKQRRFEALVGALTDDLYRYACWLCGDSHLAEDLVQETLLRAWRFLDALKDTQAVKGWLITTLRREHARLYERKRFDYAEVDLGSLADPDGSGPEKDAERHVIRRYIAELPVEYREPLVLQVLLGCSVREIADIMGLKENAVMTRLFRARKKVSDALEGAETGSMEWSR